MGDTEARTELAGPGGVPETLLSQALIASLPADSAPAPWECHCSALLWLGRGGRGAAEALPSALRGASALATVGGFVRYTDTPVGGYDEVFGIVGSRSGVRPWGHVAFMAVDSPASLVGGRTNWAMPKTLARFEGDPGVGMTGTGADELRWSVRATPRAVGPGVPFTSKGLSRQQFSDGRIGESRLSFSGRLRPAIVTVDVSSAGGLGSWLRRGRHVGVIAENATFTLDEPRFS